MKQNIFYHTKKFHFILTILLTFCSFKGLSEEASTTSGFSFKPSAEISSYLKIPWSFGSVQASFSSDSSKIISLFDETTEFTFQNFLDKTKLKFSSQLFHNFKGTGKLSFLAGNLSVSSSLSRLKSPVIYFSSALKNFSMISPGFSASPAQSSSPASVYSGSIGFSSQHKFIPSIELCADTGQNAAASVHKKIIFDGFSFQFNSAAGLFTFTNKGNSSWFNKSPRFLSGQFLAGLIEFSISSPFYRMNVSGAFHERPLPAQFSNAFPWCNFWARTNQCFTYGLFTLNADCFACDGNFYTAKGTLVTSLFQADLNPQVKLSVNRHLVKAGLLGGLEIKLSDDFQNIYKGTFRLDFSVNKAYGKNNFSFASRNGVYISSDEDFPAVKNTLSLYSSFEALKISSSFSMAFSEGTSNFSFWTGLNFRDFSWLSFKASCSAVFKENSFYSGNVSCCLQASKTSGTAVKFKITGKIIILFTF